MSNKFESQSQISLSSAELLDTAQKSVVRHQAENLLHSAAYAGLQAPVTAVAQAFDRSFGTRWEKGSQLLKAPEAKPWSVDWHVQQVGSAAGMILPFLAVKQGLGCVFRGPMAEAAMNSGMNKLTREELRAIAGHEIRLTIGAGAVYGGLLTPVKPEEGDFVKAKLTHATTGALTFAALGYGTMGIKDLATGKHLKGTIAGKVLQNDIASTMLAGAPAGVVAADAHSILSGKGFASMDQRLQSAYSFSMVGGFLAGGQKGIDLLAGSPKRSNTLVEQLEQRVEPAVEVPAVVVKTTERAVLLEPVTARESCAKMLADLQARVQSGDLKVSEIPTTVDAAPVTFERTVQELPRLKAPENRPSEAPLSTREYSETFLDHVAEQVRVYRKEGLRTELVVPEAHAAKLERFAELTAEANAGGPGAAAAKSELATPAMQEMVGQLTPAETFALIQRTPEPNVFKRVVLSGDANPFDPWFQRQTSDPNFRSNADSVLGQGETGLYRRKMDKTTMMDVLHEFAHHFERAQPIETALFHMGRRVEPWQPRDYAGTPREHYAILTGEYALHAEKGPVLQLIEQAPIKAAMIGEALYQRLSQIPPGERSLIHDFYMERALLLRNEALPIAQQKLVELASVNPNSKSGQNALKLLLFVGEPQHLLQVPGVKSLNLSYETAMGNTQVGRLNHLKDLDTVDLGNTNATTDGVVQLQPSSLISLGLRGLQYHDYGVPSLPSTLRVLDLSRTSVTDGAIPALLGLKHLQKLDVSGSGISPTGVGQLREGLPGVEIVD
ncbi:MAG: hypothetical protein K2W95_04090 [Candidatus Obscuribacterales bacterium]|nr:hypothetical protein [Candidatus Obscuribacterales bacterium]